jgi:hypothetical protein
MANWSIANLPGIEAQLVASLATLDLHDTQQLVGLGQEQQIAVAAAVGLPLRHLQKLVAMASLAQLPSVGCQYCGLLLHSGIISVAQLAVATPYQLHRSLLRLQVATLQRRDLAPPVELVQQWVAQARELRDT